MPRVLVTGASGFIGGYLVAEGLKRGCAVTAAVRSGSDLSRLRDPRIQLLYLPLHDARAMAEILRDTAPFRWVIHNAGVTKALYPRLYREGNAGLTRQLCEALQHSGTLPEKFLLMSSLAAVGTALPGASCIHPDQPPAPLTHYGRSKLEAEQYLQSLGPFFPWVVLQPTAVYGPWERDLATVIRLAALGLDLRMGTRPQQLSFVHAADVARAAFTVLAHPRTLHQKYLVSDGRHYTTDHLSAAIHRALGGKKTIQINIPFFWVRQIARLAHFFGKWRGQPSVLNPDKMHELMAENWHCDASALFHLGFQPEYDLERGMEDTVRWFEKEGEKKIF